MKTDGFGAHAGDTKSYRDLTAWQVAIDLVDSVYTATRSFPDDERFGLTQQLRRCVVSIPSNIAEGYGRKSTKDYIRFLMIANDSLKEVETQLIIAVRQDYLNRDVATPLWDQCQRAGQLINALANSLHD